MRVSCMCCVGLCVLCRCVCGCCVGVCLLYRCVCVSWRWSDCGVWRVQRGDVIV